MTIHFLLFLSDLENAVRALNLCNGYKLHGKPMIIQYGRSSSASNNE